MKLILVRHGETLENKKNILMGQIHGTLSQNGIEQAKKLALRLKDEKIDYIYSSDLARSANTAKEIQKYYPKIKIIHNKLLRETDFGDYTGKVQSQVDMAKKPQNMETKQEVQNRMLEFFKSIRNELHKNKTILIIAHFGCNVAFLSHIMKTPVEKMLEINQDNTAVNIIEIKEDDNHNLVLLNCTNHLD